MQHMVVVVWIKDGPEPAQPKEMQWIAMEETKC
jgi:hypothetical protein